MRHGQRFLMAWIAVVLAGAGVLAEPPPDVELQDDGYHYAEFRDGRHDANYVEWWYFNLFDEEQRLQAIFHYSIIDPENLAGLGIASVGATMYTAEGVLDETDSFPPDAFYPSYEQADVVIDEHFIEVIDASTYRIVGSIGDGHSISWDLVYRREERPWFGADRQSIGLFPWEQMSWLVYMPGASVSGEVRIDGQAYRIEESPGYHDHNWGEWIPITVRWNWAQYFEPGLAFELGDFRGSPAGVASIDRDGHRTTFSKEEYLLIHVAWGYDLVNRRWYPTESWLFAGNESLRIAVNFREIRTKALEAPVDIPFLPWEPLLYEQTAGFHGAIWQKNSSGRWIPVDSFEGKGFKEYTTLRPRR